MTRTTPPVRRTQAERSEATRERLMEATVALLRIRGYGGLRTSEVSERAGVSRGAQLHHFPNKNALVIATIQSLSRQMIVRAHAHREAARADGKVLDHIIADALDFFFGDYFFITLAISTSDERNQELIDGVAPYMGPCRFEIEREWVAVLRSSGLPKALAEEVLALTLSLVRGFALRSLIEDDRARVRKLLKRWRHFIDAYIAERLPPSQRAGISASV